MEFPNNLERSLCLDGCVYISAPVIPPTEHTKLKDKNHGYVTARGKDHTKMCSLEISILGISFFPKKHKAGGRIHDAISRPYVEWVDPIIF